MKHTFVINAIVFYLILLFTYAAVSKLLDYQHFSSQLQSFPYLPRLTRYFAWTIPFTELVIVYLLSTGSYRLKGFIASVILLTLFTLYLALVITFSPNIPCSCGGILQQLTWKEHIVFNILSIGMAVLGFWLMKKSAIKTSFKNIVATNRGIRKPE